MIIYREVVKKKERNILFSLIQLPKFMYVVIVFLFLFYLLGELWIHQRALLLFPRYFMKWKLYAGKYQFNQMEKNVLVKFGRNLAMWSLIFFFFITVLLTLYHFLPFKIGACFLVLFLAMFFFHYYASFKDGCKV